MAYSSDRYQRTKDADIPSLMLHAISTHNTDVYITNPTLEPGSLITFVDKRIFFGTEPLEGDRFKHKSYVSRVHHPIPQSKHLRIPPEETFYCYIAGANEEDVLLCWYVRRDKTQNGVYTQHYTFNYINTFGNLARTRLILRMRPLKLFPEFEVCGIDIR